MPKNSSMETVLDSVTANNWLDYKTKIGKVLTDLITKTEEQALRIENLENKVKHLISIASLSDG